MAACHTPPATPVSRRLDDRQKLRLEEIIASSEGHTHSIEEDDARPGLPDGGLTSSEIATLRQEIAAVEFPAPAGTVERLVPYRMLPFEILNGDSYGDPSGYVGSVTRRFALDDRFALIISQDLYSRSSRMYTVDRKAQIVAHTESE